jgi:hypothetical protein
MKTLEQIMNYDSQTLDGRDVNRLACFIQEKDLHKLGFELNDEYKGKHEVEEYTRENILRHLETDLAFAFEKALNQRGISSSFMHDTICMWNWILEEGLEDFDEYAQYGLPTYKVTAVKYGFNNPIGDDIGNEDKYAEHY